MHNSHTSLLGHVAFAWVHCTTPAGHACYFALLCIGALLTITSAELYGSTCCCWSIASTNSDCIGSEGCEETQSKHGDRIF